MRRRHLVPRFWSSAVKYSKMMISQNLLTPHLTLLHLWHFIKIYFKLLGNAKLNRIHAKAVFWWSEAFHALISHTHESILQMISKKGFLGFFFVVLCQIGDFLRFLTPDTNLKLLNKAKSRVFSPNSHKKQKQTPSCVKSCTDCELVGKRADG